MSKVLFSLFDHSGVASKPYKDNGWHVEQIDIKNGRDILDFYPAHWMSEYLHSAAKYSLPEIGIIAAVPCTDYALSGARHFKNKDESGITERSQVLVEKTKQIIDYFTAAGSLLFWYIENPMSRIHTLNKWMGKPVLKFNPCDFAGYSDEPLKNAYNKNTWLWGNFNIPEKKRIEPIEKAYPGWKNLGGKSERTKELRSITPDGFAKAFYLFNH